MQTALIIGVSLTIAAIAGICFYYFMVHLEEGLHDKD